MFDLNFTLKTFYEIVAVFITFIHYFMYDLLSDVATTVT